MKPASKHNYDTTSAQRQAKRRTDYWKMHDALESVAETAETLDEAKEIARAAIPEKKPSGKRKKTLAPSR